MCISVDLPEPDGPVAATNSPGSMSSDTPRSACTFTSPTSYVLMRSRTEMTGITDLVRRRRLCRHHRRGSRRPDGRRPVPGSRRRLAAVGRLAHRAGNHVRDDLGAFLQFAVQRLNQLGLLTVA